MARLNKENVSSRAYIAFKSEEQLAQFSQGYDSHLFRDKAGSSVQISSHCHIKPPHNRSLAGNESIAVVEFAPYQKIPTEKKKNDARGGTIYKDEDFLSFLESLKNGGDKESGTQDLESLRKSLAFPLLLSNNPVSLAVAANQPPAQPKTTPLLEALKAQKEKESIQRAHAHYNPTALLKKEKEREKEKEKEGDKKVEVTPNKKALKKAKAAAAAVKTGPSTSPTSAGAATSAKQKPPRHPRPPAASQSPGPSQAQPLPTPATATASVVDGGERRQRPVIIGGSRGFEAALSGAGVAAGSGKSRREKKEKEKDSGNTGGGEAGGEASGDSPKNERKRKEKDKDTEVVAPASVVLPPAILPRGGPPKIIARPPPPPTPTPPAPTETPTGDTGVRGGRGGGARARARGRGRGGAGRGRGGAGAAVT